MDHQDLKGESMQLEDMSKPQLEALAAQVDAEIGRRTERERVERRLDAVLRDFARQEGRDLGAAEKWVQPTHALNAYPRGAAVTHNGKVWDSLMPANPHEPGVSGWRERATVGEDGKLVYPAYVHPTGAHDAYRTGERITVDGQVWESLIDRNVWPVHVHPDGWALIEEAVSEPEPPAEPEPDPEPEPEPAPDYPEWDPDSVVYKTGDTVAFGGVKYVCAQPHTSQPGWTPAAVPALWGRAG